MVEGEETKKPKVKIEKIEEDEIRRRDEELAERVTERLAREERPLDDAFRLLEEEERKN